MYCRAVSTLYRPLKCSMSGDLQIVVELSSSPDKLFVEHRCLSRGSQMTAFTEVHPMELSSLNQLQRSL
jgi:hypothetical protein